MKKTKYELLIPFYIDRHINLYSGLLYEYLQKMKEIIPKKTIIRYDICDTEYGHYTYNKYCFCIYKNIEKHCSCGVIYLDNEKIHDICRIDIEYDFLQRSDKFYKYISYNLFKQLRKYNHIYDIEMHYKQLKPNLLRKIMIINYNKISS